MRAGSLWLRRTVRLVLVVLLAGLLIFAFRLYQLQQGPPLGPWHTFVPDELSIEELEQASWDDYLQREDEIFSAVRKHVTEVLDAEERTNSNRYYDASPVYPPKLKHDWNRSYTLHPEGPVQGVVVLLHGLTDSPYSLRHIAQHYQQRGFVAVAIRLPAHGTVPAALTSVVWEEWAAATRLAVRQARQSVPEPAPLHMVGFSNGGALALNYTLDALKDASLPRPDRLVLISPMVGITQYARFAGLAGWPAVFPAFAKAAWLSIVPEFNPFKYNSFPANGGRQSWRLTQSLQGQLGRMAREGKLQDLPPIITFQSVLDFTVSTRAVVNSLYALLPDNGSELILFDLNRATKLSPLFRNVTQSALARMLPETPRAYQTTVITNAGPGSTEMIARITDAGSTVTYSRPLEKRYPREVYSLSHVALPFPETDALYGSNPVGSEDYGINFGAAPIRGEVGVFITNMDTLTRLSFNPFFPYLLKRIDEKIDLSTRAVARR